MLTFTLVVMLLFPSGDIHAYELGFDLTYEDCQREKIRALTQLDSTLSEASVWAVDCIEEREA